MAKKKSTESATPTATIPTTTAPPATPTGWVQNGNLMSPVTNVVGTVAMPTRSYPRLGDDVAFYDERYQRNDLPRLAKVVEEMPNGTVHLKVFARPSLDVQVFGTEHHVLNVVFKNMRGLQGIRPSGQVCTWLPE